MDSLNPDKSSAGNRRRPGLYVLAVAVLLAAVALTALVVPLPASTGTVKPQPVPEFTQSADSQWHNSKPLKWRDLRGKVVLIDFWTFECWNCYRSFPWLHEVEAKFARDDFTVIGIHTPEFKHEHERRRVAEKIKEFKLEHPVMMDNDYRFWRSMNNRYWPAFYLVDKWGQVRGYYIGETHSGTSRAREIEKQIRRLLAES